MAAIYEETLDLIPRISFKILTLMLVATDVFAIACSLCGIIDGYWQVAALTVTFTVVLLITFFVKVRITADETTLTVRMIREFKVPFEQVIDVKKGDIDIMRNYSGWGIKKVKFKNYTVPGVDGAVSAKLTGRRVLTMTTANPDELHDIIHRNRRQD